VQLEGLDKLKNVNDLDGNQTRDLPAFSIAPQPLTFFLKQHLNSGGGRVGSWPEHRGFP
jgi:hypothetical protein